MAHVTLYGPNGDPLPPRRPDMESLARKLRVEMGFDRHGRAGEDFYDAASHRHQDLALWNPSNPSAQTALTWERDQIATRIHSIARNDGWASAYLTRYVDSIIGAGWLLCALPNAKKLGIKGGVGKTTVARALIDYVTTHGLSPRVFDTEFPKCDLANFYPSAKRADITSVAGQAEIFDDIGQLTIVDIAAGVLSKTVGVLDRTRILDDAVSGKIKIVLLHVLDSSIASLAEICEMQAKLPRGVSLYLVKNHKSTNQYSGWEDDTRFINACASGKMLTIPALDEDIAERVQAAGGSYVQFANSTAQSSVRRRHVSAWLGDVFAEFQRIGLTEA